MEYADVPYTYMCIKDGVTYISKMVHFIVSNNLCNNVVEYFINNEYLGDNVAVKATLFIAVHHKAINSQCSVFTSKIARQGASEETITVYTNIVDDYLIKLQYDNECLKCKYVNCKNHNNNIQTLYEDVLNISINAADQ